MSVGASSHNWVYDHDEEMTICSECDCYRGSKASMRACRALFDDKYNKEIEPLDGRGTE